MADATAVMPQGAGRVPTSRIYRQYQIGNEYMQFERFEGNMLYGFRTCTGDCPYSRIPFSASFDGTYLTLAYGHHADLYTAPGTELLYAQTTGNDSYDFKFRSLWRYTIEGRNLVADSALYNCEGIAVWYARFPVFKEAGAFCEPGEGLAISGNWVAMTDEVLTGEVSVPSASAKAEKVAPALPAAAAPEPKNNGSIEERLRQLKQLRDEGIIDAETYEKKKNTIIEGL